MTDVDAFIESFLEHGRGDKAAIAEYNRQYYLRNRELKGRRPKRVEEDQVPMKSPNGAKLVDFDGKGAGKATYSDGSTFDGNGWHKPASRAAGNAAATRAKRLNEAQRKAGVARRKAKTISDPKKRRVALVRLNKIEQKLEAAKRARSKTRGVA